MRKLVLLAALAACATVPGDRHQRYLALSDDSRALYEKYHQFMTDSQQDRFLNLPDDDARKAFVADLHVEERLAKYPKFIQDAIWKQDVVVGMDGTAVMLSWGPPDEEERREGEDSNGVRYEKWIYRHRGDLAGGRTKRVVWMTNGQVSDLTDE